MHANSYPPPPHCGTKGKRGWGLMEPPPHSFLYDAVFQNDCAFSGKPKLMLFSAREGLLMGGARHCWRPVTSPTMVVILAAILDITKEKKSV